MEENGCFDRKLCSPLRAFTISIADNAGREVIRVIRPLRCTSCCFPCFLQEVRGSPMPSVPASRWAAPPGWQGAIQEFTAPFGWTQLLMNELCPQCASSLPWHLALLTSCSKFWCLVMSLQSVTPQDATCTDTGRDHPLNSTRVEDGNSVKATGAWGWDLEADL